MAAITKPKRDQRLDARITAAQKRILEQAAAINGTTVTNFVIAAAEQAARETIEREHIIRLTSDDIERFAQALENPPKPNKAMREAMADYRKLVDRKE